MIHFGTMQTGRFEAVGKTTGKVYASMDLFGGSTATDSAETNILGCETVRQMSPDRAARIFYTICLCDDPALATVARYGGDYSVNLEFTETGSSEPITMETVVTGTPRPLGHY